MRALLVGLAAMAGVWAEDEREAARVAKLRASPYWCEDCGHRVLFGEVHHCGLAGREWWREVCLREGRCIECVEMHGRSGWKDCGHTEAERRGEP